jgi:hypothetical protein
VILQIAPGWLSLLGSYGSGDADIDGNAEQFLQALPVAAEWVTLDFSNRSLPERFTVTLADDGQGWGEWLAVALMDKAANGPE